MKRIASSHFSFWGKSCNVMAGNFIWDLATACLDTAKLRGAKYADVRVMHLRQRDLTTKNGQVGTLAQSESIGLGVRVLASGGWGFASTDKLTRDGVSACAAQAVSIAKASALAKRKEVVMAHEDAYVDSWVSPFRKDPFEIPLEKQLDLLLAADAEMRRIKGVTLTETDLQFRKIESWFASSIGSRIHQSKVISGCGMGATSFKGEEIQKRSYPNSFGGQHALQGYELVEAMELIKNAPRIGEEAVALHSAAHCPQTTGTLILGGSQLGLQIHESVGHPIELDRVLGEEANFAGTSFLTLDKLNKLRYGSGIVNVVADARLEHGPGLGSFAYDDEGVPAQCTDIIKDGEFRGYLSNRESAHLIGLKRSSGTMRTESWNRLPIIRMTNISLLPGTWKLDDLIADTDDAILMETNRSWSIDDRRYQFQFSTEIGWEIKGGKRGRMLKNPSYSGITTEFWNSCDAICGADEWVLWGTPNCGKGQPMQTMGTGHGASPSRFRNVRIGAAFAK
jgi:TldD protein